MRVTRKYLEEQVRLLNVRLNRPTAYWNAAEKSACVGHLMLDTNSPGDGWTRYRLAEVISAGGGQNTITGWAAYTAQEMAAYLSGIHDALDNRLPVHTGREHVISGVTIREIV